MLTYRLAGSLETLDHLTPALWDAGACGLEERAGSVLAYFDAPVELPFGGEWVEVPDEDWVARFRESLHPVRVGRLTVVPSWREAPDGTEVALVLDPGLAFGTGHHETTRMALGALQALDLAGSRVLDVGAGSGILAIAAMMLGALSALGVDTDPVTLPAARENAARNGAGARFMLGTLDDAVRDSGEESFDLIVANLFAELHELLMPGYRRALRPGGQLLLTGILAEREPKVERALGREGFGLTGRASEGEWVLLAARRPD